MQMVWDIVVPFSEKVIDIMNRYTKIDSTYHISNDNFSWNNFLYTSSTFRRAHIEIVDARNFKKIWVMHMTIFPYFDDPSPIFGFDVVCGANKITGAFHDFSKIGESPVYEYFQKNMQNYGTQKSRQLPDWAKQIFSPAMLAVSNLNTKDEVDNLTKTTIDNLEYYLYNIGNSTNEEYIRQYNSYCKFQKMNPHTPAMMESIGVDGTVFKQFMDDVLFPEYYGHDKYRSINR